MAKKGTKSASRAEKAQKVSKKASVKPKSPQPDSKKTVKASSLTLKPGPKENGVTIGTMVTEIPEKAILNAIRALRKQIGESVGMQAVTMTFTLATVPEKPYQKHILVEVPHSVDSMPDCDICVIVPDGHKAEYMANEEVLDGIDRIIENYELRKEHPSIDSRQDLASSYDLFLCDRRLSPDVGVFLGKSFRTQGKDPVLIDLGYDGSNVGALVQQVETVRKSTRFQVRTGQLCGVMLGRSDQDDEILVENAPALLQGVSKFFTEDAPESHRTTITKVDIKLRDSKAIPLFCHEQIYVSSDQD